MAAVEQDATAACRRPGRPRSAEADEAIIAATLDLFAELGFDGLTVEGVAVRAGVSKATIYRRYPSKVDLVMAAALCITAQVTAPPDTGNVGDDLRILAGNLIRLVTTTVVGKATPMMVAETIRNPELARAHREFIASRRAGTAAIVRRGIERGELRADTDPEVVADLVAAPVFYRLLISGDPIDNSLADTIVHTILRTYGT
jgi:AcrR family transcriptional regulator